MRPKVVIGIAALAAVFLVVVIFASKTFHPQAQLISVAKNESASAAISNVSATSVPAPEPMPVFVPAAATVTNDPAAHAKYVHKRIEELNDLAMNNDTDSRDAILSELETNSDKQIRSAALEAAIQFDDRSVVPRLQQIAAETQDPQEKSDIEAAIDYINLPSLTEYVAAHPPSPNSAPVHSPHRTRLHPSAGSQ
jgi:hypothetical protein